MKLTRTALLISSFSLAIPSTALAETYVVASGGSDNASGLSGSPWATLQHAADSVGPGDTVIVEPGDYAGFFVTTSGTESQPITFSAKPGVNIVSENTQTGEDGINIEDTDNGNVITYVVIEGFNVNNMARAGIRTAVSSHITIRNNKADQNGKWGIFTGFSDDILIEGNECSRSGIEHGIYFSNSADRPIIRKNIVWGNNANGIHMNGDASLGGDGVIRDALVEANIAYDNGKNGGSGINCDGVSDSIIQNNLVYNTHASGISLYQIDGGEPSQNNLIVNNTILIASDGRWALNIRDGAVNNKVYNNILWNAHSFRGAIDIAMSALPGFVSDNNLMIDRFTTDDANTILTLTEWQAATGNDAASIAGEATYVNVAGDDYHLASGSPGVDQGTSTSAPATDLEGVARPQGAAVDIGAYELCPTGDCVMGSGGGGSGSGGNNGGAGGNSAGGSNAGGSGGAGVGGDGVGANPPGPDQNGGCGCRVEGLGRSGDGLWMAALAALVAILRRRRA